jgi:competence protein ComEA
LQSFRAFWPGRAGCFFVVGGPFGHGVDTTIKKGEQGMKKFAMLRVGLTLAAFNVLAAVNVNTATQEQLESLNGIGPAKAKAIIDYRNKNGAFKTVEDLDKVPGIGAGVLGKIKGDVTLTGSTTVKADAKGDAKKAEPAKAATPGASAAPVTPAAKAEPAKPAAAAAPAAKPEAKKSDEKADKKAAAKAEKDAKKAEKDAKRAEKEAKKAGKKSDEKDEKKSDKKDEKK